MDTQAVVEWLASGLIQLSEPNPRLAPVDLQQVLSDAFQQSWDGRGIVDELVIEVRRQSAGEVTLQYADPASFLTQIRGPGAYLVVTGRRPVILAPSAAQPLLFDSTGA
jgi:hypothetical protein